MTSPDSTAGRKAAWKRGKRALFVLACLGIIEWGVQRVVGPASGFVRRSADPELGYELRRGTFQGAGLPVPTWEVPYRVDDNGCRIGLDELPSDEADVIVLGSSMGFGMYVTHEETISEVLERAVAARGLKGVRFANCSVPGYRVLATLRAAVVRRAMKPKLVVSIMRPHQMRQAFPYGEVADPRSPVVTWMIKRSGLARLAWYLYWREPNSMRRPFVPDDELKAALARYATDMQGTRALFYLIDDKVDPYTYYRELRFWLTEHGVRVEPLKFPKLDDTRLFVDRQYHWSKEGAEMESALMIDALVEELRAAGLGQPSP